MTNTMHLPLNKKKLSAEQCIYRVSLFISASSILYLLSVSVCGLAWLPFTATNPDACLLALLQCLLGAGALHIPLLLKKATRVPLPDVLCTFFYIFILCATVLGELFSLYYAIPFWDDLLHFGSGIMAGMLGAILLSDFLHRKNCEKLLSPLTLSIAAICFAVCIGVFWEIYEFAGDSLLGLNMQKCLLQDGSALVGKTAIADTMKDLIVDTLGGFAAAVSTALAYKRKKEWIFPYSVRSMDSCLVSMPSSREAFPYSA